MAAPGFFASRTLKVAVDPSFTVSLSVETMISWLMTAV